MLLLLESSRPARRTCRRAATEQILDRYLHESRQRPPPAALPAQRPRALLAHDLRRLRRQGRERAGAELGPRNAKLRTSRKLLFASGLLPVLRCHVRRGPTIAGFLAAQFALPPMDRVADAFLFATARSTRARARSPPTTAGSG